MSPVHLAQHNQLGHDGRDLGVDFYHVRIDFLLLGVHGRKDFLVLGRQVRIGLQGAVPCGPQVLPLARRNQGL